MNLNGLRSATSKGLLAWLQRESPDVLLLQEVRAEPQPLLFETLGYHSVWFPAERPGYSGVAVLSREEPLEVVRGLGWEEFDLEGRWLHLRFRDFDVASLYVPSGSSGEARQTFKYRFLDALAEHVRRLLDGRELIIGGDYNIAHREIDLRNWRSNQKNSGFLPEERAWMTQFLDLGLADVHRGLLGERAEYTWWSNRGQAYANDVGWRLDYQLATPGLHSCAVEHAVDRPARLSDHAPLRIRYGTAP
nr:exodeoxyribonuclease III [Deinobacterium chartae]